MSTNGNQNSPNTSDDHVRRHDIAEALQTFEYAIRDLENGYKFNDSFAEEKIKLLKEAFSVIKKELREKSCAKPTKNG